MKATLRCLFLAALTGAQAQPLPALPEEFASTESIVLQDEDELQATVRLDNWKLSGEKRLTAQAKFEYGLTDRWQLEAAVPYTWLNPDNEASVKGIGDVEVATRYGVLDDRKQPFALDVGLDLSAPAGDRGRDLGEGRLAIEPLFTASRWLSTLNAQFNFAWRRAITNAGKEPRDEFEYNLAVVCPLRGWFLVIEGNGESTHRQTKYYVTPEVIWRPRKNVEFLLALPVGVTRSAGGFGVTGAITVEFDSVLHRAADKD
jgi:hypothetical protein